MERWLQLLRERFPPGAYLPMVAVFVAANALLALEAQPGARPALPAVRAVAAGALALSFFLRLRLFDEIKDYEVDLRINPTRPLARGLLSIAEVKRGIGWLVVLEGILAATLGPGPLAAHAIAIGYSFLMYNEFFIGPYLRPHLTTYAVTHTFVSILLGHSIASAVTHAPPWALGRAVLLFGLANWALFNVFEFARKTYAPDEEREGVDTYSSLFRPSGAVLLAASQVIGALIVLGLLVPEALVANDWYVHLGLGALVVLPGLVYAARPRPALAKAFRGAASAYILLFFATLVVQLLR